MANRMSQGRWRLVSLRPRGLVGRGEVQAGRTSPWRAHEARGSRKMGAAGALSRVPRLRLQRGGYSLQSVGESRRAEMGDGFLNDRVGPLLVPRPPAGVTLMAPAPGPEWWPGWGPPANSARQRNSARNAAVARPRSTSALRGPSSRCSLERGSTRLAEDECRTVRWHRIHKRTLRPQIQPRTGRAGPPLLASPRATFRPS
jgi:hypothetical protein